jgi:hypothetical protein
MSQFLSIVRDRSVPTTFASTKSAGLGVPPQVGSLTPSMWLDSTTNVYTDAAASFAVTDKMYLTISDNASLRHGDTDFTWAGWFNPSSFTGNAGLIRKGSELVISRSSNNGNLSFAAGDQTPLIHPSAFTLNQWSFVVCWLDRTAGTLNIQVNNGTVTSVPWTGTITSGSSNLQIGANTSSVSFFDGAIDGLMFFKSVLDANARTFLYNGGLGRNIGEGPDDVTTAFRTAWNGISAWNMKELTGTRNDSWGTNHLAVLKAGNIIDATTNNGGFETLGAGANTPFGSWTFAAFGTSMFSRDTLNTPSGAGNSLRWDFDSAGNELHLKMGGALVTNRRYKLKFKGMISSATDPGATGHFQAIGGTIAAQATFSFATAWQDHSCEFVATGADLLLRRPDSTAVANKTIRIANVELQEIAGADGVPYAQPITIIGATTLNGSFDTLSANYHDTLGSWGEVLAPESVVVPDPINKETGSYAARFASKGGNCYLILSNSLVVGRTYAISVRARRLSAAATLRFGDANGGAVSYPLTASWATYNFTWTAKFATAMIYLIPTSGHEMVVDNVTLEATDIPAAPGIASSQSLNLDPVAFIQDRSAAQVKWSQTVFRQRPIRVVDANGVPCLRFDGIDDFLTANGLTQMQLQTKTIIVVGVMRGTSGIRGLLSNGTSNYYVAAGSANPTQSLSSYLNGSGVQATAEGTGSWSSTAIKSVHYEFDVSGNGTDVTVKHYSNGVKTAEITSPTGYSAAAIGSGFFIGAINSLSSFAQFDLYALLVFPRVLTPAERASINYQMAMKYKFKL